MTYETDRRMDLMLAGLPDVTAALARTIRQALLERIPECRENYHGGRRVGLASYKLGENGPSCCNLQARSGEVRLFFSGIECLGDKGGHLCVPADAQPDWAQLKQALDEAIFHARNRPEPRLAS